MQIFFELIYLFKEYYIVVFADDKAHYMNHCRVHKELQLNFENSNVLEELLLFFSDASREPSPFVQHLRIWNYLFINLQSRKRYKFNIFAY